MAGLGNEMAAGGGRGHLRASHADREHVIETLKAAYVYGLVTKDELDARVGQTLASRTYAELALVTADLPAGLATVPPPGAARAKGDATAGTGLRPGDRAVIATAILAGLAYVAAFFAGNPVAGLLALGAVGSGLVSLLLAATQMLRSRRDNRSGGQRPPQRAVHTGPGAGRRVASAASAEQLPHTSKPWRRSKAVAARSHRLRPQLSSDN